MPKYLTPASFPKNYPFLSVRPMLDKIDTNPTTNEQLELMWRISIHWFCPHTLGRYPKLPQNPTKKTQIFINCWWNVRGIFQGYVGEILDLWVQYSFCCRLLTCLGDLLWLHSGWLPVFISPKKTERTNYYNYPPWNQLVLWKSIVRSWNSFWDGLFQRQNVSFRECRSRDLNPVEMLLKERKWHIP